MVALCSNHAAKADNAYYPDDYFETLKQNGLGRAKAVEGEFDYLRRDVLAVIGSNIYYNVDTILEVDGQRSIFFNRDDAGYLLLNFKMPTSSGHPRAWLEDNVWVVQPGARNIECPPRGRFLSVEFENGDVFRVEFSDVYTIENFRERFPASELLADMVQFPLTVAEFWERSKSAEIELGRKLTRLPGNNSIRASAFVGCSVGMSVNAAKRGIGEERTQEILAQAIQDFYAVRHP